MARNEEYVFLSYRKGCFNQEKFNKALETCKYSDAIKTVDYMEDFCSRWYFEDEMKCEIEIVLDKKRLKNDKTQLGNYFNKLAKSFDTIEYEERNREYTEEIKWK